MINCFLFDYFNQSIYICNMEKKRKGGKRPGAGRKKGSDPTNPYTFYVKRSNMLKFESPDKFKKKIQEFIEKADLTTEIKYAEVTGESYNGAKLDKYIKDEPPMFPSEPKKPLQLRRSPMIYEQLILDCQTVEEYEPIRAEIEAADHLTAREKAILLRKR